MIDPETFTGGTFRLVRCSELNEYLVQGWAFIGEAFPNEGCYGPYIRSYWLQHPLDIENEN